jgi:hypothetical protein
MSATAKGDVDKFGIAFGGTPARKVRGFDVTAVGNSLAAQPISHPRSGRRVG